MSKIKLYKEEQVRKAIEFARDTHREGRPYLERDVYDYSYDEIINMLTSIELPSDEELAILFHNKYEELAPKFKYETKIETKKFNKDSNNGKLMIAVCKQILEILNQNK